MKSGAQEDNIYGLDCSGTISIRPYMVMIYSQDQSESITRRMLNASSGYWIALNETK